MGDTGDDYKAWKEHKAKLRRELGVECIGCKQRFPKANPTILLPGQKCFCGYRDKRGVENDTKLA